MSVLMYGSETVIWKGKERSRIRDVQMNSLRGLLGIRRMDNVPNAQIRELCRLMKGLMIFYNSLAMRRKWRMIGFLRGSMW